ncbi:hypothetical protein DNI29_04445 [Hymenobacter sediminis]|uniref:hypothetical protein n=1 Tax=Hymenobacter sediminis TaxID=2218621 RepID=UPI000DA6856C|nr:hypothetical protein [Hymenobacter sediminis]RPD50052.1 hypothetical protein DNI29_04445 [Hymenobacter sediminis]
MLRPDTIAQKLLGIVGWRVSADDSCSDPLPKTLTDSRSGLVVNDLSELLSSAVIRHIVPRGEKLADFLTRITLDETTKLVARVQTEQNITPKVLLPAAPLLNGQGSLSNTVNHLGRFVGFRLKLPARAGLKTLIPRIGLQLDKVLTEPLKVYVYSDAQAEPVKVLEFENIRAGYTEWLDTEGLDISFATGEQTAYIGYYEQDLAALGARAVQRDFGHLPCQCPNDPYLKWGSYAWPRAISVPATAVQEDFTLWGPNEAVLETQNFGLNLELASMCDVAATLSSDVNQQRLAEALQLALARRICTGIVTTANITQLTSRQDVQADALALMYHYEAKLYGGKEQGTDNYYPSLLKTVQLDLSGLDTACQTLPKDRLSIGSLSR